MYINEEWVNTKGEDYFYFMANPKGFWCYELGDQIIGVFTAYPLGPDYGFLGDFLVQPEFRGKGYGKALWKVGVEHLGSRNIGAGAVKEMVPTYESWGYKPYHKVFFHRFIADIGEDKACFENIKDVHEIDNQLVLDYDIHIFGYDRSEVLKNIFSAKEPTTLVHHKDGKIQGYGIIK